jgi:hypothetical protein
VGLDDLILAVASGGLAVGVSAALAWAFFVRFSVRVPPNRAAVLYGRRSADRAAELRLTTGGTEITPSRIVVGGRAFVPPWNRGVGYLSLQPVMTDVTVRSIDSLSASRASGWEVRLSVQTKLPSDPELLRVAAENLLGKSEEEVRAFVRHTVEGVVPTVLSRLPPGEPGPDWERLAAEVQAAVASDLIASGLVVRSLSVTGLLRIAPTDPSLPAAAAPPVARPTPEPPVSALPPLEVRVSRVERSLGIIGAEIVRVVREGLPPRDGAASVSVLDFPLGSEAPLEPFDGDSEGLSVHDSIGDAPPSRLRRPSDEPPTGRGSGPGRPLLDVQTER